MNEPDQVVVAEVVVQLGEAEAVRLDSRIRLIAGTLRDNFTKLQDYVHQAKASDLHIALGFASWTAYLADALGGQPLFLARDERQELVEFLSSEGMSTRAIAKTVGASKNTVTADLQQVSQIGTPPPKNLEVANSAKLRQRREFFAENPTGAEQAEDATGEAVVVEFDSPNARVRGIDGKNYPKRRPRKPIVIVDPAPTTNDEGRPRATYYPFRAIDLIQMELDKNPRRKGRARYLVYRSLMKIIHVTDDVTDLLFSDNADSLLSVSSQEATEYRAALAEAMAQLRKLDRQLARREVEDA